MLVVKFHFQNSAKRAPHKRFSIMPPIRTHKCVLSDLKDQLLSSRLARGFFDTIPKKL